MSESKLQKLTLEQLINRKLQGEQDKLRYKMVDVEALGGSIMVKKLPLATVLKMLDNADTDDLMSNLEFMKELIYSSCDMFRKDELREAYREEIAEPYDIVTAVLDENIGAMSQLSEAVLAFYGLDGAGDAIKN